MQNAKSFPAAALLLAALAIGGCATSGSGSGAGAGAGLETADSVLRSARAANTVNLVLTPAELRTGEQLRADIHTDAPGYLYLYQIGTDGRSLDLVFPNAVDGANYLAGGHTSLPRPNWRMRTRGPAGVGYFIAVVADQPQDLLAIQAATREGRIQTQGPYAAAMAMLRETQP
ncbi:MAG: DUF4384 domain-containing protein [Rhodocyclaceae bacterium]|nr:DUF4384 domain-containing protein [Rhodocyclaceae bacterium]